MSGHATTNAGRIPVAVLGATGVVGQRLVRRLAAHPSFRVASVFARESAVGRRFADACAWRHESVDGATHGGAGGLVVRDCRRDPPAERVVFSALDSATARDVEPALARAGALVFSNAATFRMEPDVPLLVPEVNADAIDAIAARRAASGGRGAIVCNPNCTATILALALAPLDRAFGVEAVSVTTLQALSGAGWPGVPAVDALGNVIPFIAEEEAKVEEELAKILGRGADLRTSATCTRVPVIDGHTESVSVKLRGAPTLADVRRALAEWRPALGLPSAPATPIVLHEEEDRPQPRLDVEAGGGMPIHVGRIRACPVLGVKFVVLGHNAERGAAGGAVLNAELALARGLSS